jgi:hypothetical protein
MRASGPVLTLAAILAAATAAGPAAAGPPAPFLPGIRPLGMGGAFVAVADDRNALHYNPAGLARLEETRISGLGLHGGLDDQFFEVVRFIQDHEEDFSDFESIDPEFYDALAPYDDRWVASDVHAFADLTRPGFGIGAYSTGRLQFKVDRGVYEPRVQAAVFDDIVALSGGAMPLGRFDVTVGGTLKAIWRRESTRTLTAREVSDFDPQDVLDDLAGADPGFGMDLGARWQRPDATWAVGGVLRDAATFVGGEKVATAVDLGVAWRPRATGWGPDRSLLIAADLRDTFGSDAALGTKIRLGAEFRVSILALRAGLHQGYPTFGTTLDFLRVVQIDYAFYGRELGEFPGAEAQFLHALEARLGSF